MKKLTAIICTIAMLFSLGATAYGAQGDILFQNAYEYDAKAEYWMELNKPLDILSYITEFMFTDDQLNKIDMQYLIESILKSKVTVDVKAETDQETLKKAKIEMKINFNIPVSVSEDIKNVSDLTAYVWMDLDITSEENAKYLIVVKNPLNGKYLYLDLFEEAVLGEEMVKELKKSIFEARNQIDANAYVGDINQVVKDAYLENAVIVEKGRTTTVTFTNDSFIELIFDLTEDVVNMETWKELFAASGLEVDNSQFAMLKPLVKGLGIFSDKDAIVMTYTTDRNGKLKETSEKIHFEFNIVELCEALGLSESDLYPITKDKADVDLTLCAKATYNKFNESVRIEVPALTEENSVSLVKLLMELAEENSDADYDYDYNYDYDYEYDFTQVEEFYNYSTGVMDRAIYASVDEFLYSAAEDGDNVKIEYSTEVKEDGREVIRMVISSDYVAPTVIEGSTEGFSYTVNGEEVRGGAAFMYIQGYNWETYEEMPILCVNTNILEKVLGCRMESATMYFIDYNTGITLTKPECEFWFVRTNPAYVPVEDYELNIEDASAIGIIGGADGPTEIFIME